MPYFTLIGWRLTSCAAVASRLEQEEACRGSA